MLESFVIILMGMGFFTTIMAKLSYSDFEAIIEYMTSIVLWLACAAGLVFVQVPSDTYYLEYGLVGICLLFIFRGIIGIFICYFNFVGSRGRR